MLALEVEHGRLRGSVVFAIDGHVVTLAVERSLEIPYGSGVGLSGTIGAEVWECGHGGLDVRGFGNWLLDMKVTEELFKDSFS